MLLYWENVKVKVKVTLVQALRPCTGHTAHRGSRGIALPFHDYNLEVKQTAVCVTLLGKCKGKGKGHSCTTLRLCAGRMAHRGSRGIALPFHDHGTRRR